MPSSEIKRKYCMLTLARSHQCTQLFSISSQRPLNHRLRKSIVVTTQEPIGRDPIHHVILRPVPSGTLVTSATIGQRQLTSVPSGTLVTSVTIGHKQLTSVPSGTLATSVTSVPSEPKQRSYVSLQYNLACHHGS
jgi:hypothetical protein